MCVCDVDYLFALKKTCAFQLICLLLKKEKKKVALKPLFYLRINNKYQCSSASENHLIIKRRVKEVNLPRKIPYLKVDKGAVGNILSADLVCALQEESLIRWHFMKDNFLNGRLSTSSQSHEQDSWLNFSTEGIIEIQNWIKSQKKKRNILWQYD